MPRIWPTTNPGPSLVPGCYSRDRSLLSCRLSANVTRGALNLYAALPRAYGAIDRTKALNFAAHAGIALGAAEAREDADLSLDHRLHRIDGLISALATREIMSATTLSTKA